MKLAIAVSFGAALAFTPVIAVPSSAATVKSLYHFCRDPGTGCGDGSRPQTALLLSKSGTLYGTTMTGGAHDEGVVFALARDKATGKWAEQVLYSFCPKAECRDGEQPMAGLIMDGAGRLYGTVSAGGAYGNGAVFRLALNAATKKWGESLLYSFCWEATTQNLPCADGADPEGTLLMDDSGVLYGTTASGGTDQAPGGVAFKLEPPTKSKPKWIETVLYGFCAKANCEDGDQPQTALTMGAAGTLYGVTPSGGAHRAGTVFVLHPPKGGTTWTETVLYSFCAKAKCADGDAPVSALVRDAAGTLYGTTPLGGAKNEGAVFAVAYNSATRKWVESVPHSFCAESRCGDGFDPLAGPLIIDKSGNLYGTTPDGGAKGGGTVFELRYSRTSRQWGETVLHSFCAEPNCQPGWGPSGGLTYAGARSGEPYNGTAPLYGTAAFGGTENEYGTVFELTP